MNYPQTVIDLIHWDTYRDHDTYGWFTVITGYEGTGRCFWCGEDIIGRRRFCKRGSDCWTKYQEHFNWGYASTKCLHESNYTCANCNRHIEYQFFRGTNRLEVHHIIPLNGEIRAMSAYNIPWNLICLCHECHMLLHATLREQTASKVIDIFQLAESKGQGIFDICKSLVSSLPDK